MDHKSGEMIAIKIIRNKSRFHKQGMIEIKILDELRKKDREKKLNIIHMIDHFNFRNHLCISFELLGWVFNRQLDTETISKLDYIKKNQTFQNEFIRADQEAQLPGVQSISGP